MSDLTKSSLSIALGLINDANGTTFTNTDVSLGSPVINDQVINTRNTLITLTPIANATTDLPVDLTYNRLSLKSVLEVPYCQLDSFTPSRIADILPVINAKYQINLTVADIVDAPYRPTDVITGIKKVSFSCQATGLVYTGDVTVYIGAANLIYDWFSRPHYQINSDFNSVTFQGNMYSRNNRNFTVPAQTVTPTPSTVAAYLGVDNVIRIGNTHVNYGTLLAHFVGGVMKEVLGTNGATSYDNNGNILPIVPAMPNFLSAIPEDLKITAQVVNNRLSYSSTYDVGVKKATSGITYYVDGKAGADSNDGSTFANAFKTFAKALNAMPAARIIQVVGYGDYFYDSVSGWNTAIGNRTIDIIGYGTTPPIFTGTVPTTNWTNQIANVWYIDVPYFGSIVDTSNTDNVNGYIRLSSVKDIGTCQTTVSSYFYDTVAGRLYVNTFNGRQPDASILLVTRGISGYVADNSTVYIENLKFDLSYAGFTADMSIPRVQGYLYTKNCQFGWTATSSSFNSYGFNVIQQNPTAKFGYAGGLSYNSDKVLPSMLTKPWVVELNATVSNCGFSGTGNSPASSITALVSVVRFKGVYATCDGNMVQDTGDQTRSLNIGCSVSGIKWGNSDAAQYTVGLNSSLSATAFYYSCTQDDAAISYYPKGVGKIILHDTLVGYKPAYQRETPYLFAYTA